MSVNFSPAEMNVLLLYDYNPQWTPNEKDEVAEAHSRLTGALSSAGFSIDLLPVVDQHFPQSLSSYDSQDCVLFNWCDGIPGLHHSEYLVVRQLEQLGFVFTGSSSATLSLSHDKRRVKEILDRNRVPTPRVGGSMPPRKPMAGMSFRRSSNYYQFLMTEAFTSGGVPKEMLTEVFQYTTQLAWHFHFRAGGVNRARAKKV